MSDFDLKVERFLVFLMFGFGVLGVVLSAVGAI